MSEKQAVAFGVIGALLVIAIGVACSILQAGCESRAYNRLTGANTTTWDAMWLELRVQDAPRK